MGDNARTWRAITRLQSSLRVDAPWITWFDASIDYVPIGRNSWRCLAEIQIHDPNVIMEYVKRARAPGAPDFYVDPEYPALLVFQDVRAHDEASAKETFARSLELLRRNVLNVSAEIERYNAALPYLISRGIELRVSGCPLAAGGQSERDHYTAVLDAMEATGEINSIEERDPASGKPRKRYFHPDFAPEPD